MKLTSHKETWDPFQEMEGFAKRWNRVFGLTPVGTENETLGFTNWSPYCDTFETEKEYRIRVELPGVPKEDVRVTLENGLLTIQGERKDFYKDAHEEDKYLKYHRREFTYGDFFRRFRMPDNVDESKVEAMFKDGVLDVTVYKTKVKAAQSKEVAIR